MMINHGEHPIKSITTESELRAYFKWEMSKVKSGAYQGSWMTTAASPPMQAKDAI